MRVSRRDAATLAAPIPPDERDHWAGELRALARLPTSLADQLAGSAT